MYEVMYRKDSPQCFQGELLTEGMQTLFFQSSLFWGPWSLHIRDALADMGVLLLAHMNVNLIQLFKA